MDRRFLIAQSRSDDCWKWKALRVANWTMDYSEVISHCTVCLGSKDFDIDVFLEVLAQSRKQPYYKMSEAWSL